MTVALDSDAALEVVEGNRRYNALLLTKQGADRYSDQEAQTLEAMKKSREVQSSVLVTVSCECQATQWDISDTYAQLDEVRVCGMTRCGLCLILLGGRFGVEADCIQYSLCSRMFEVALVSEG